MADLLYEALDGVAVITLNRPERGNSLTYEMLSSDLPQAWERAAKDAGVGAIVLTSSGDRAFCTGVDVADPAITEMMTGERPAVPIKISARQNSCQKPVVTAINGACSGGGLILAADSDIAVATADAKFTNHGASLGIAANVGAAVWAASGRLMWALQLSMLGANGTLSAEQALHNGVLSDIVARDRLRDHAIDLASRIASNSPSVIRSTKRTLWQCAGLDVDEAMVLAEQEANEFSGHPDAIEARRALKEERVPVWQEAIADEEGRTGSRS